MKKATFLTGIVLSFLLIGVSCSKSSEDTLAPQTPTPGCDTANAMYSADVAPILTANCYNCHGNGKATGGVNLDTYANVKTVADNGSLLGTITHASGYPPMPQGGPQLSDCEINKIRSWINNGTQNN